MLNILNLFSKKTDKLAKYPLLFDNAPYLTPWYINENSPRLIRCGKILKWEFFEKIKGQYAGLLTLKDSSNTLFGLINAYNYIHPSPDNSKFIIWNRGTSDVLNPCVSMKIYCINELLPIEIDGKEMLDFSKSKTFYFFSGEPLASIKYYIDPLGNEKKFVFPEEFKIFNPFLAVCNFKGLYKDVEGFGDTVILEFNPKNDTIKCFPQHWFNKSNADFGYEWITRAIRDNDGIIHGQGFRISDFILDDTGRELKK